MRRVRFAQLALLSCLSVMPALAHAEEPASDTAAQPSEQVSPARALFKEGRELASAGNYAAACPKFEESLRLELGVGTQFNLADCWEHIGKTASARALFLGAAASAKAAGQLEREQVLRDRATALEPRLSKLVIDVADASPKLSVRRDELPIDSDSWGKAAAVDPGTYTITAKAPGKKPWTKQLEVKAGQAVVTVEVPKLEDDEPAPAAAVAKPETKPQAEPKPEPTSDRRRGINYKALGLGGFGVVALGVGTLMGLRYKSANGDAQDVCPSNRNCTQSEITRHDKLVDRATTARGWSYAGFGVGALSLAGAAALFFFDSPEPAPAAKSALRPVPWLGEDGRWGASVDATF